MNPFYFIRFWLGVPPSAIRPLQQTKNAASWLVFNLPKFSHTILPICTLHRLLFGAYIRFNTLIPAEQTTNSSCPSYNQDMVKPCTPAHPLRSATANPLATHFERGTAAAQQNHVLLSWLHNGGMSYWHQDNGNSAHH